MKVVGSEDAFVQGGQGQAINLLEIQHQVPILESPVAPMDDNYGGVGTTCPQLRRCGCRCKVGCRHLEGIWLDVLIVRGPLTGR